MPFLNTLVTPKEDGTLTTCVYRKPTHTDLYLQWDSHHNLACKFSVINTLTHRARAVCSNSELLKTELKHIEEVLSHCKYPKWTIDRILCPGTFQRGDTLRNLLMFSKDNEAKTKQSNIMYWFKCGRLNVMKNILGNQPELLKRDTGNTLKQHHPFLNMRILLVTKQHWGISKS